MYDQPTLFQPDTPPLPIITNGHLQIIYTEDGRTLLWMTTTKGTAWLELLAKDQQWLAEHIVHPNNSPP